MIHFAISRLWLFHAELSQEILECRPEVFVAKKGEILKEFTPAQCRLKEGKFHAKCKEYPESVVTHNHTHDVYNAIDIDADPVALKELLVLFGLQGIKGRLAKFRYRITDYSHLNIITIFELEGPSDLEAVKMSKIDIVRKTTEFTRQFKEVFEALKDDGKIILTNDYFGIPQILHPYLPLSEEDTYYYEEFAFVSGKHLSNIDEVLSIMEVSDREQDIRDFDGMKVQAISPNPVWRLEEEPDLLHLTTLIEPQNLIAAEINIYSSIAVVYFSIIKLLNSINHINKKTARDSAEKIKAISQFNSDDLRQLQLKFGIILKEIVHRKDALFQWQIDYINEYRLLDDFQDKKDMAEKAESLLSVLMDKKDQEESKKHSHMLETITISFTFLTICSVYADIINFIEGPHNQAAVFDFFTIKNIVVIFCLCLCCVAIFYLFRKRR